MYRILIVDDEYPARQLMRMMIERLPDYEVAGEADNGQRALELYQRLRPDLVLTDIEMPVMNGLELIENIRRICPEQRIVILSCYESFAYAQRAMRSGVRNYLIKDMTGTEELKKSLDEAVRPAPGEGQESGENLRPEGADAFDKLRRISPAGAGNISDLLDRMLSAFFSQDEAACLAAVRELCRLQFSGMLQYSFLQFIGATAVEWITRQTRQYGLEPEGVFGAAPPAQQLEECASADSLCSLVCAWISGWMKLAREEIHLSLGIRKALHYLAEHYAEEVSLETIAGLLYVHPVHVSRTFKSETNANFNDTLNMLRIAKAKLLLAEGGRRVSEIAFAVGYNSVQGFYSAFRRQTGRSPADFSRSL